MRKPDDPDLRTSCYTMDCIVPQIGPKMQEEFYSGIPDLIKSYLPYLRRI